MGIFTDLRFLLLDASESDAEEEREDHEWH
jgi:hypothetical protein